MPILKSSLTQLIINSLISGAVIAAILGFIMHGQKTKIETEIKDQFQKAYEVFLSKHDWKERSLSELLGPVTMQLRRTKLAFMRWDDQNLYLETKIMQIGNQTVRDLLLTKGHLIPPELRNCSSELIQHYDVWLEKFEEKRLAEKPDLNTKFIFVGPDGYPFPRKCEERFHQSYEVLWKEVYGDS